MTSIKRIVMGVVIGSLFLTACTVARAADNVPYALALMDGYIRKVYLLPVQDGCPRGLRVVAVDTENRVTAKGCRQKVSDTEFYMDFGLSGGAALFKYSGVVYGN